MRFLTLSFSLVLFSTSQVLAKPASRYLLVGKPSQLSVADNTSYIENILQQTGGSLDFETPAFWRVEIPAAVMKASTLASLNDDALSYVEEDVPLHLDAEGEQLTEAEAVSPRMNSIRSLGLPVPNDPRFESQYYLSNTGQGGGAPGVDVSWLEGFGTLTRQAETLVAVCDDGIDIDHPDLARRVYRNTQEIPGDGIDNDSNGYVDDISGWDFFNDDANPRPDLTSEGVPYHHGTMTSGLVSAEVNNGVGIAGVAPSSRLLPLKIDGNGSSAWMSSLVRAIDYAIERGARVISVSYNIDGASSALADAIGRAQNRDAIYVNSAGNGARNVDARRGRLRRQYTNVLLVASNDRRGNLGETSNYGLTVDVIAPGVNILSLLPSARYGSNTGTSFSAPIAAGALAVLRSLYPTETHRQILSRLIMGTERLASVTVPMGGGLIRLGRSVNLVQ